MFFNKVLGTATQAERDQVARHAQGNKVFETFYLNQRVKCDIQSAVLERPSEDALIRMFTHMSLTRDPRAPVTVPDWVRNALPADPEIAALEQQRKDLKGGVYRIQGTVYEDQVRYLTAEIGKLRSQLQKFLSDKYRENYFKERPIKDIEAQIHGEEEIEYIEPVIELQIPERAHLVNLICPNENNIGNIGALDVSELRVQCGEAMYQLCLRREIRRRYRCNRPKLTEQPVIEQQVVMAPEPPEPEHFPVKLDKLQCPFCIGDETKLYADRTFKFSRSHKMREHVDNIHLKDVNPEEKIPCYHPACKFKKFKDLMHLMNHIAGVHDVSLNGKRFFV